VKGDRKRDKHSHVNAETKKDRDIGGDTGTKGQTDTQVETEKGRQKEKETEIKES
jgi:hypothetical protein